MLRLALMGDLHYPVIQPDNSLLFQARQCFYDAYLNAFFAAEADWHLSIGDLTHVGHAEEFSYVYRQVSERGVQFRQVLGNHDVLTLPKKELVQLTGQPLYEAVETDEALLLFLDTTKELELHGWGVDREQRDWLDDQVGRAGERPMLIFAHHPVPGTTSDSPDRIAALDPYQDIWPILSNKRSAGVFFNGHTHTHSIAAKDGWHFVQTAACLCDPCYRIVEVDADEVRVTTVPVDSPDLACSRRILHDQLSGFHRPQLTDRHESDLFCTVGTGV